MTKILTLLMGCLLTVSAYAEITTSEQYKLDRAGGVWSQLKLGTELYEVQKAARYTFSYTDADHASAGTAVLGTIPAGAIVTRAYFRVSSGFTSQGTNAATINLQIGTTDVKAATAVSDAAFANTGIKAGVQDDTLANFLYVSSASSVKATWANYKLTAGALTLVVEYTMAQ